MTAYPAGPFAMVFFSPTCCYAASFSSLLFPSPPPWLFSCRPAFVFAGLPILRACELSGVHDSTATCEVPILRPQLEHTTSKKTAARNTRIFSVGYEREHRVCSRPGHPERAFFFFLVIQLILSGNRLCQLS